MLLYIIYMTLCMGGGMMWFTFYFNSLLVFRFQDDYRSFRFISYDLSMFFMMFVGMTLAEDIKTCVMIFLFLLLIMLFYSIGRMLEKMKYKKKLSWKRIAPLICY